MRMTLNLGDDLLADLMHLTRAKTRTEAVNRALGEWVRRQRIEALKSLRGKLALRGALAKLRALEVREAKALGVQEGAS